MTKRAFDLVCTIPGLLVLAPILVVVAMSIKLSDGGPVFFRQERIGAAGTPFRIWKFRTMRPNAEKSGGQLTVGKDPRITWVGYWLRRFKIDELPQLFNVLAGEMSLVGPRPEVALYVSMYTEDQSAVLKLIPGITDPASIKYRDESRLLGISRDPEETYVREIMPEKILLNLEYAERANRMSDLFVVVRTILGLK